MTDIKIAKCEKLNNVKSIRFYVRLFFHLIAVLCFNLVFLYGLYLWYLFMQIDGNSNPLLLLPKWYTPLYLTNWNFMFQTLFLTMSIIYDVMEWLDHHNSTAGRRLRYIRDLTFSGLVVPMTLFIFFMFWIIFWIDRELVFPKVFDQLVPWWFNHCVHTNITIVLILETILQARRHPANMKIELIMNGTCDVAYAVVYYSIYFFSHRWLYEVFGIMTWWQVCLFQLLIWISTFIFYFIQFPINRIFHKQDDDQGMYMISDSKSVDITRSWDVSKPKTDDSIL